MVKSRPLTPPRGGPGSNSHTPRSGTSPVPSPALSFQDGIFPPSGPVLAALEHFPNSKKPFDSRSPRAGHSPLVDSPRFLLVCQRLPVLVERGENHAVDVTLTVGGLASALRKPHQTSGGIWIGYPGDISDLEPTQLAELSDAFDKLRLKPVNMDSAELEGFNDKVACGVLWPLFHYLLDRVPLGCSDWPVYKALNQRYADTIVESYRHGDMIWIHDYQLFLVPGMIRKRLPNAKIGFFLHIPFPSSEVFRQLPWRNDVLEGLLGADLVGFHQFSYLRHFATAVLRILGLEADVNKVGFQGRQVNLGCFPIGIDAQLYANKARDPNIIQLSQLYRRTHAGTKLIVCVDRLDYTKGILHHFLALEFLLEHHPEYRGKLHLIQVATMSKGEASTYGEFQREVHEIVGRIDGLYSTPSWSPITYINRCLSTEDICALYLACDVMLVTPIRDGMNLVSKEFVACRNDLTGILVLSEFAGAVSELGEALHVNPFDIASTADTLKQALEMEPGECARRMASMRARVLDHDVTVWVEEFTTCLAKSTQGPPVESAEELLPMLRQLVSEEGELIIMSNYDGTLVPLALQTPTPVPPSIGAPRSRSQPLVASPDPELADLLTRLSHQPHIHLYIASGRDRKEMEDWLGHLPIGLFAEHCYWARGSGETEWEARSDVSNEWKSKVLPVLHDFAAQTPGSFVEEKVASVGWHYRGCDMEFGSKQAKELRLFLLQSLSSLPLEVLQSNKLVEVRVHGISKALAVQRILAAYPDAKIVALGDERSDEDMFSAVNATEGGVTINVGQQAFNRSTAAYRLRDVAHVRSFLRRLLDG